MLAPGYGRDHDPVDMARVMPPSPELDGHRSHVNGAVRGTGAKPQQVGTFRFWFQDQRWEWSDELCRMYGYEPGSVVPTTELVLSHKHLDDRDDVEDLLDRARHSDGSFSSRHRLFDTAGHEHSVVVVAERMLDETEAVVGASGYYIDLTEALVQSRRDMLDDVLPKLFEARSVIEQAKGALRLVYGMNDEQAFRLLQWRSQESNTKLRALATQLVAELETVTSVTSALRTEFDHLIMTVHERAPDDHDS
jgi:hypothetical protein